MPVRDRSETKPTKDKRELQERLKKYAISIVKFSEELDETMFWLEFTVGLSEEWRPKVIPLWKEGDELLAIIVSSIVSTKRNNPRR